MYSLEVSGLTKRVGNTTAINDVSFTIPAGESLAVLGPQGCGKTMLLRLLSGLEQPDQGRVLLHGIDVTSTPVSERKLAVLLHDGYGLIPHMTVSRNIALPLQNNKAARNTLKQQVEMAARSLQVDHLLEQKVSTLSEKELLHVALARGLVKQPQLMIFDESFMQMDTPSRLAARREVTKLQHLTRISFLYMTRDQPEAFALVDRVAVMNEGEIQQIGTRAELFYAPATLWIAQWLGFPPMNTISGYLQGTYQPDGLRYRVWAKSMTPILPLHWTQVLGNLRNPDVVVGIRAEDIIPEWDLAEKWNPALCEVYVQVIASEWNQGKTLARLQLPHTEDQFMAVFDVPHGQLKVGQQMTIALDPERFCLFHPRTEKLLHAPSFASGLSGNRNTSIYGNLRNPRSGPLFKPPSSYRLKP